MMTVIVWRVKSECIPSHVVPGDKTDLGSWEENLVDVLNICELAWENNTA